MKRYVKSNTDFNHWYNMLSQEDREEFNDLAEHNVIELNNASDTELKWLMQEFNFRQAEELNDTEKLLTEIQLWAKGRTKKFKKFEKGRFVYFEKHSIEDMIRNYIKYFNRNVGEYGDGFAADWDDDDWMDILYKNGKVRSINPSCDEGTKRISTDGIDSIILNGSWGTAIAGPSITFEDYTVYPDIPDIRAEFDV